MVMALQKLQTRSGLDNQCNKNQASNRICSLYKSFSFIDSTFLFTCFCQEKEHWMNLCEAISDRCYIIGDNVCHRPGLFKDETLADDFQMSAVTFRLEEMTTVTDILTCVRRLDGTSHAWPFLIFAAEQMAPIQHKRLNAFRHVIY